MAMQECRRESSCLQEADIDMRVLLIDDDKDYREEMEDRLRNDHHVPTSADSVEEAIKHVSNGGSRFDVIALDLFLKDNAHAVLHQTPGAIAVLQRMTLRQISKTILVTKFAALADDSFEKAVGMGCRFFLFREENQDARYQRGGRDKVVSDPFYGKALRHMEDVANAKVGLRRALLMGIAVLTVSVGLVWQTVTGVSVGSILLILVSAVMNLLSLSDHLARRWRWSHRSSTE